MIEIAVVIIATCCCLGLVEAMRIARALENIESLLRKIDKGDKTS